MNPEQINSLMASLPAELLAGQRISALEEMTGGNTSKLYKIKTGDGTFVLKLGEEADYLRAEAAFLERWREIGVRTPKVYHFGHLNAASDQPFLILEFIDGQNLFHLLETGQLPAPDILRELGLIQARLHQIKGHGFGRVVFQGEAFRGEYGSFREEMAAAEFQEEIRINLQAGRLREQDLVAVQNAIAIVHRHAQQVGPVLAHTDFRAGNVLYVAAAEPPYVVIDPNPWMTHPYMCLAYSFVLETVHAKNDPIHLLAGYSKVTEIEPAVLTAASLLVTVSLLSRWGHASHPYAGNLLHLFAETKEKLIY